MKRLAFAICSVFLFSHPAFANEACDAKASEKKLNGAAKTSFLKKCESDAKAEAAKNDCEGKAAEKKLNGAARTSFLKMCERDSKAETAK